MPISTLFHLPAKERDCRWLWQISCGKALNTAGKSDTEGLVALGSQICPDRNRYWPWTGICLPSVNANAYSAIKELELKIWHQFRQLMVISSDQGTRFTAHILCNSKQGNYPFQSNSLIEHWSRHWLSKTGGIESWQSVAWLTRLLSVLTLSEHEWS